MTSFINGQVKTVHLCAQCAAKRNKPVIVPGFSFSDFMSAFYEPVQTEEVVCGNCGMTLTDFQRTGRLGCANCYKVFESRVLPVLKGIHMNEKHTGKRPGESVALEMEEKTENDLKKQKLTKDLRLAISSENFEEAGRQRDEIALLDAGSPKSRETFRGVEKEDE